MKTLEALSKIRELLKAYSENSKESFDKAFHSRDNLKAALFLGHRQAYLRIVEDLNQMIEEEIKT